MSKPEFLCALCLLASLIYSLPCILLASAIAFSSSNSPLRSRSSLCSSKCEGTHASGFSSGGGAGMIWKCTCELTVNLWAQNWSRYAHEERLVRSLDCRRNLSPDYQELPSETSKLNQ